MLFQLKRAALAPLFSLYAAVLAGCATSGAASSPEPAGAVAPVSRYNLTGYSENFKQGYGDACAGRRNDVRFKSDSDYHMGWNDGRTLCRR